MKTERKRVPVTLQSRSVDLSKTQRADMQWMVDTIANASDLIVAEGLDDDEEVADIRERLSEIAGRYGLEHEGQP